MKKTILFCILCVFVVSLNAQLHRITENDKFGFADSTGNVVIPCQYDNANFFSEGLVAVNKGATKQNIAGFSTLWGGKWGFINEKGKTVIPFEYDKANDFYDGFAIVEKNKLFGYIDKKGKELSGFKYDYASNFDKNGIALIKIGGVYGKYGFIDKSFKYIINPNYDDANKFVSGISAVKMGKLWGAIDLKGNIIIPLKYDFLDIFEKDEGLIEVRKNWNYGFIDAKDNIVIPIQYKQVESFKDGKVRALDYSGKWITYDSKGNIVE